MAVRQPWHRQSLEDRVLVTVDVPERRHFAGMGVNQTGMGVHQSRNLFRVGFPKLGDGIDVGRRLGG